MPQQCQFIALGFVVALSFVGTARAQLTPEQQADMTLSSASKAYNEKNYPFAVARFREYLGKFANHKDVNRAKFGLALAILDGPEKDRNYQEAQQILAPLAGDKTFPDQGAAAYQLAHSFRTQAVSELIQAETNPGAAAQLREQAKGHFAQAGAVFAQALPIFQAAAKEPGDKDLSPEWEWVARTQCDLAEMLLRQNKVKETQAAAEPFVKDANLSKSRYKDLGRYLYAYAAFLQGEMPAAQKTLTMLAPFANPDFGPHARYLLARTHHLADERGDALTQYEAVINDYKKVFDNAAINIKEPQRFGNDPVKRAEFEVILRNPFPDHVARSKFYLAVLQYEAGRFAEAKNNFLDFAKVAAQSPLKLDADLRVGFCQVQMKDFAEAQKTLQPLAGNEKYADQAFFWIAKAQIGLAPDAATKFQEYRNALGGAINTLRTALNHVQRSIDTPEGKARKGEILLEIADLLQLGRQQNEAKEAANTYQIIVNEKLLPVREEEVLVRQLQALHLAKEFDESDARCKAFLEKYPKSTLAAVVAFTAAENAFFRAANLEKTPPTPERNKQLAALYDDTLKRHQFVLEKFPEYPKILLVRYSLGLTNYRKGDYEKAFKAWNDIPAPERAGELADTPFLMADCVLRQTPTTLAADADALAAGKLEEQLKTAAELLEGFVAANPKDANVPDALLKYGLCQQRRSALCSDVKDKQAALASARNIYERLGKEFPNHPLAPESIYERAKVMVQQGDVGGGMNELRRFTTDPLKQARIAPMAAINLATLLRSQNNPAQAADLLQNVRQQSEGPLGQDPTRANWVSLLRFHHAAALREAGKLPEAKQLFDQIAKQAPKTVEGAESALRYGQTVKEEGLLRLDAGKKQMQNPKEAPQAPNTINEGYKLIRDAAGYLESTADQFKGEPTVQEQRARMLYEAAWAMRMLAEPEIDAARLAVARELVKKLGPAAEKAPLPAVALDQVPLQPAEKKARDIYKSMIDQFADVPLSHDARFELAEMMALRNENDAAVALLNETLDKEPNVDVTEKIRLRLGSILGAKGNVKGALAQFEAVAQNTKSKNIGWANYRAAEVFMMNKDFPEAVKRLVMFRDNPQFNNVPGLSDRAMLRLGHAYQILKAWPESFQAFDRCVKIAPNGPWLDEAHYGLGWALQQQNNHDGAVNWYVQVVGRTAAELAAKAQFQIGVCRYEQKRHVDAANAFLVIPSTYDYPELSAAALLKAAEAYHDANNREQAERLLHRVIRDYPNTEFAEVATERLMMK